MEARTVMMDFLLDEMLGKLLVVVMVCLLVELLMVTLWVLLEVMLENLLLVEMSMVIMMGLLKDYLLVLWMEMSSELLLLV